MKRESKTVGRLIKETRKTKGMTQMELSERVGVSYQQIQKYEKGFDTISVERLKQIAKALDVPITLFFPSDKDTVAETPATYGRMTDDEHLLLQLFRRIKDKKCTKCRSRIFEGLGSKLGPLVLPPHFPQQIASLPPLANSHLIR